MRNSSLLGLSLLVAASAVGQKSPDDFKYANPYANPYENPYAAQQEQKAPPGEQSVPVPKPTPLVPTPAPAPKPTPPPIPTPKPVAISGPAIPTSAPKPEPSPAFLPPSAPLPRSAPPTKLLPIPVVPSPPPSPVPTPRPSVQKQAPRPEIYISEPNDAHEGNSVIEVAVPPPNFKNCRNASSLAAQHAKPLTEGKNPVTTHSQVSSGDRSPGGKFQGIGFIPNPKAFAGVRSLSNYGLYFQNGRIVTSLDERFPWCTMKFVKSEDVQVEGKSKGYTLPKFHYTEDELIRRTSESKHLSHAIYSFRDPVSGNSTTWIQVNQKLSPSKTVEFIQCMARKDGASQKLREPTLKEILRVFGSTIDVCLEL